MIEFNPDEIENLESNFEYQEKSIQLIKINGVKYELNASALDLIRSIEDEIIVVTAIGKEKTGKSYLLNLLLDNIGRKDGVIYFYN
jgi:ABC-type thiamine transport system ATPase subunit